MRMHHELHRKFYHHICQNRTHINFSKPGFFNHCANRRTSPFLLRGRIFNIYKKQPPPGQSPSPKGEGEGEGDGPRGGELQPVNKCEATNARAVFHTWHCLEKRQRRFEAPSTYFGATCPKPPTCRTPNFAPLLRSRSGV
jgi:hypothetical protein